jgi:hypothetical protein
MYDDSPYELDDPKHESFYERYADYADMQRKRMKEDEFYAEWVREQETSLSEGGRSEAARPIETGQEKPVASPSESDEVEGHA